MKTEGTLICHKITVATGLLQNNAYGHELVVFCLIIPCVHVLFMFTKSVSNYSGFAIARSIDQTVRYTWHTELAPAVLAAVKTEFSYVIIRHHNIGYIPIIMDYITSFANCLVSNSS